MNQLTTQQAKTLTAIQNGAVRTTDVANKLKISTAAASASLKRLVDHGFARRLKSGELKVNASGLRAIGVHGEPRKDSKMAKAVPIIEKMQEAGKARKDIIEALVSKVGLTPSGASTYISNHGKTAH